MTEDLEQVENAAEAVADEGETQGPPLPATEVAEVTEVTEGAEGSAGIEAKPETVSAGEASSAEAEVTGEAGAVPETATSEATPSGEPDAAAAEGPEAPAAEHEAMAPEELLGARGEAAREPSTEDIQLKAVLEAIVYVTEEPLSLAQISAALAQPRELVSRLLDELVAEFDKREHGVTIREVAGGYKMTTKPEHHETVRNFVKSLKPPLKLSLPALETLAVIAYKQPVTAPEIMEIRGVQGAGVLKTLVDRKLIAPAGRKNVIGKPILYKTTKEFLVQFGLKDLAELPSLKEFEDIRRMAIDGEAPEPAPPPAAAAPTETAEAAAPDAVTVASEAIPTEAAETPVAAVATETAEAEPPAPEQTEAAVAETLPDETAEPPSPAAVPADEA
ncbi:MAG: SMC-Scp complex subunit ScpB [Bryobacteraceae bacterium]